VDNNNSITIIDSKNSFNLLNFYELFNYKDLFYFLVLRDIKVLYKQTILGFSWAIIRPVFSMIILSFIFGVMAKIPSDDIPYPIFSYIALVPWTYFSTSVLKSTQSLLNNIGVFNKVYFPRIIIPLVPAISGLIDFFISINIVFILMVWYGFSINIKILLVPLLILIMFFTSSGIGMWLSALAIQYRDVRYAINFLVQLLFYITPVVWPISLISHKFGDFFLYCFSLYPMIGVIEGFRVSFLGNSEIPWDIILIGFISSFLIFLSGIIFFKSKEKFFSDVA